MGSVFNRDYHMGFTAKHQDGEKYWHATTRAEGLRSRCGGTGILDCLCGGDFCVCGNFGEVECMGCPDCDYDEDSDFGYDPAEDAP